MPRPTVPCILFLAFLARAAALALDRSGLLQGLIEEGEEPSIAPFEHGRGPKTHLVSFRSCSQNLTKKCNGPFFEELRSLSKLAARIPSIEFHHLFQGYPPEILSDKRWAQHEVEGVRGRGFWFWKPAILNLLLKNGTVQDGDVVIWADADVKKYFAGHEAEQGWQAWLMLNKLDFFVQSQRFCEAQWTKGDVFQRFKVPWWDSRYGLTPQAHGQFFILRVNKKTRRLLQMWEELMSDFHLVSDEPSRSRNPPLFIENRHDQSILSLLMKANMPEKLPFLGDCKWYSKASEKHSGRQLDLEQYDRRLHPEFGIANLSVKVTDFPIQRVKAVKLMKAADMKKARLQRRESTFARVKRRFCVQGSCYNLDHLESSRPKEVEAATQEHVNAAEHGLTQA